MADYGPGFSPQSMAMPPTPQEVKHSIKSQIATVLAVVLITFQGNGCRKAPEKSSNHAATQARLTVLVDSLHAAIEKTEHDTVRLAAAVEDAYRRLGELPATEPGPYLLAENGVLHRPSAMKENVPAVFVSGAVPVDQSLIQTVERTERIDPVLIDLVKSNFEVVQSYYNDRNSYNRIYPPFDVLTQYPAGMDIPAYNFYYLADEAHNPDREAVWVKEPYVDPAGRGWMVSCIAPVYHQDRLEGVAGLDITTSALVRSLELETTNELAMVVAHDGTLVAAGEAMARILRLPPLKNHRYVDTVRSDTFRPERYNLLRSSAPEIRAAFAELLSNGKETDILRLDSHQWLIYGRPIKHLGWYMFVFEPES